jgi:hypothetical protein
MYEPYPHTELKVEAAANDAFAAASPNEPPLISFAFWNALVPTYVAVWAIACTAAFPVSAVYLNASDSEPFS